MRGKARNEYAITCSLLRVFRWGGRIIGELLDCWQRGLTANAWKSKRVKGTINTRGFIPVDDANVTTSADVIATEVASQLHALTLRVSASRKDNLGCNPPSTRGDRLPALSWRGFASPS